MRLSVVASLALTGIVVIFLIRKGLAIFASAGGLPDTAITLILHTISFYIYLKLLMRRTWAWLVVFGLNLLVSGLALATLITDENPQLYSVALESGLLCFLLYANRHQYLDSDSIYDGQPDSQRIIGRAEDCTDKRIYPPTAPPNKELSI